MPLPPLAQQLQPVVDDYLRVSLAHLRGATGKPDVSPALHGAVEYALTGPGKRLRPLLACMCAQACGADARAALPAAAAVEMVHAFSLVHDDLPAMDDDDMRRGRPTLHRHTSEAMAILAGDELLACALGALVDIAPAPGVLAPAPALVQRLVAELVRGTRAMISGQVYDTLGGLPDALPPAEKLATIHRLKTGALLAAACRMGAICAQAPERSIEAITGYAQHVGLMFQVVDDLLDVTQEAAHVGKKTGKDEGKGKLTYPGLIGVESSRAEVQRLLDQAVASLRPLGANGAGLAELARHMAARTR